MTKILSIGVALSEEGGALCTKRGWSLTQCADLSDPRVQESYDALVYAHPDKGREFTAYLAALREKPVTTVVVVIGSARIPRVRSFLMRGVHVWWKHKHASPESVVVQISTLLSLRGTPTCARPRARRRNRDEHRLSVAGITLDLHAHVVERDGVTRTLPQRQFQLLEYLMRHPDQPLSQRDIASGAWGEACSIDLATVRTFVARLRRALQLPDEAYDRLIWNDHRGYYGFRASPV